MFYHTYVLSCSHAKNDEHTFYTGYTSNLIRRLKDHKCGSTKTTKDFNTIELVYYEACRSKKDARIRELQLKTGFGRGYIKRRLINDINIRN